MTESRDNLAAATGEHQDSPWDETESGGCGGFHGTKPKKRSSSLTESRLEPGKRFGDLLRSERSLPCSQYEPAGHMEQAADELPQAEL